jgi:hypothetical protein
MKRLEAISKKRCLNVVITVAIAVLVSLLAEVTVFHIFVGPEGRFLMLPACVFIVSVFVGMELSPNDSAVIVSILYAPGSYVLLLHVLLFVYLQHTGTSLSIKGVVTGLLNYTPTVVASWVGVFAGLLCARKWG